MKNLLSIIIVAISVCCYGQNPDTSFLGKFKYPYLLLDTVALSTYFLYEKAPHYSAMKKYN